MDRCAAKDQAEIKTSAAHYGECSFKSRMHMGVDTYTYPNATLYASNYPLKHAYHRSSK